MRTIMIAIILLVLWPQYQKAQASAEKSKPNKSTILSLQMGAEYFDHSALSTLIYANPSELKPGIYMTANIEHALFFNAKHGIIASLQTLNHTSRTAEDDYISLSSGRPGLAYGYQISLNSKIKLIPKVGMLYNATTIYFERKPLNQPDNVSTILRGQGNASRLEFGRLFLQAGLDLLFFQSHNEDFALLGDYFGVNLRLSQAISPAWWFGTYEPDKAGPSILDNSVALCLMVGWDLN